MVLILAYNGQIEPKVAKIGPKMGAILFQSLFCGSSSLLATLVGPIWGLCLIVGPFWAFLEGPRGHFEATFGFGRVSVGMICSRKFGCENN